MTLDGTYVRTIGAGEIDDEVFGLAASADLIVVGTVSKVFMFNDGSGELIRSFGKRGAAEGKLDWVRGLRITPDGYHILISEFNNNRLSLFKRDGTFERCIGVGTLVQPNDVEFISDGEILVAERDRDRVLVFSHHDDGYTLLRSFGVKGTTPGKFKNPYAFAVFHDKVFVLDRNSTRVQVFT